MSDIFLACRLAPLVLISACAGPTTPFGALTWLVPQSTPAKLPPHHKLVARAIQADIRSARIAFSPARQVLHDRSILKIYVNDPQGIPDDHVLVLLYNGIDVTKSLLATAERRTRNNNNTILELTIKNLRLNPERANDVEFQYYRKKKVLAAHAQYETPNCDPLEAAKVISTGSFNPPAEWIRMMHSSAKKAGMNPNLVAGLIAQESSFNPKAISWAKAIGLTQVTTLADQEIEKRHPHWPRYEGVEDTSFPHLKTLIMTGKLDAKDDWRLNPELSIEGGLSYLAVLHSYWKSQANYARVSQTFERPDEVLAELMLASYNSGPARVNRALKELGPWYLTSPDLQEAQRYVNRVLSFCYSFSNEVTTDENPT